MTAIRRPSKNMTKQQRAKLIKHVVNFAQSELSKLTPGQKLVLREQLDEYFIEYDALIDGAIFVAIGDIESDERLLELQLRVRGMLEQKIRADAKKQSLPPWKYDGPIPPHLKAIADQEKIPLNIEMRIGFGKTVLYGSFQNMFLLSAALMIPTIPAGKLLHCPYKDCGKIFYRVRKQKYHDRQCTWNADQDRKRSGAPLIYKTTRWTKHSSKAKGKAKPAPNRSKTKKETKK